MQTIAFALQCRAYMILTDLTDTTARAPSLVTKSSNKVTK